MKRAFGDIAEGQIHYWHGGTGQVPLVYVPPGPGTARHQVPLSGVLARGRRVIVPDIPGMGDSVAPPDSLGVVGLDWFADALHRFLDGLGVGAIDLLGSSLGGGICIEMARQRPDRVRHLILNRVVVRQGDERVEMRKRHAPEVHPEASGAYVMFVWNRMRNLYTYFPWFKTAAANLRKADLPPPEILHVSLIEHLKMCATSHKAFTAYYDYPFAERLSQIAVPTMARADAVTAIPGAREWQPAYEGDPLMAKPESLEPLAAQIAAFLDG